MYAYSSLVLAAFVLLAHLVVGAPPACLLAALGAQPNPSNVKALCNSGYLEGNITSMCSGSDEVNAMSAYSSACSADGVTVSISSTGASSATTTTTTVRSSTSVTTVASSTVTIVAPIASTIVAGPSSTSSTAQSSSGSESHSTSLETALLCLLMISGAI